MSIVLSIDPGIRGVGAAIFYNGGLILAEYVKNTEKSGGGPRECSTMARAVHKWLSQHTDRMSETTLVLEWPQTYGGRAAKGDSNDLLPLAGVDAALAALFPMAQVTHYVPHFWKGATGKPKSGEAYIVETRVRARLSASELAGVKWPNAVKLTWDVSDAIGIGLKYLGRFEPKRVYPRA